MFSKLVLIAAASAFCAVQGEGEGLLTFGGAPLDVSSSRGASLAASPFRRQLAVTSSDTCAKATYCGKTGCDVPFCENVAGDLTALTGNTCWCGADSQFNRYCHAGQFCWADNSCNMAAKIGMCAESDTMAVAADCICAAASTPWATIAKKGQYCWTGKQLAAAPKCVVSATAVTVVDCSCSAASKGNVDTYKASLTIPWNAEYCLPGGIPAPSKVLCQASNTVAVAAACVCDQRRNPARAPTGKRGDGGASYQFYETSCAPIAAVPAKAATCIAKSLLPADKAACEAVTGADLATDAKCKAEYSKDPGDKCTYTAAVAKQDKQDKYCWAQTKGTPIVGTTNAKLGTTILGTTSGLFAPRDANLICSTKPKPAKICDSSSTVALTEDCACDFPTWAQRLSHTMDCKKGSYCYQTATCTAKAPADKATCDAVTDVATPIVCTAITSMGVSACTYTAAVPGLPRKCGTKPAAPAPPAACTTFDAVPVDDQAQCTCEKKSVCAASSPKVAAKAATCIAKAPADKPFCEAVTGADLATDAKCKAEYSKDPGDMCTYTAAVAASGGDMFCIKEFGTCSPTPRVAASCTKSDTVAVAADCSCITGGLSVDTKKGEFCYFRGTVGKTVLYQNCAKSDSAALGAACRCDKASDTRPMATLAMLGNDNDAGAAEQFNSKDSSANFCAKGLNVKFLCAHPAATMLCQKTCGGDFVKMSGNINAPQDYDKELTWAAVPNMGFAGGKVNALSFLLNNRGIKGVKTCAQVKSSDLCKYAWVAQSLCQISCAGHGSGLNANTCAKGNFCLADTTVSRTPCQPFAKPAAICVTGAATTAANCTCVLSETAPGTAPGNQLAAASKPAAAALSAIVIAATAVAALL